MRRPDSPEHARSAWTGEDHHRPRPRPSKGRFRLGLLLGLPSGPLAWTIQLVLASALVLGAALVEAPTPASGGTTNRQSPTTGELPGLRTRTSSTYLNPNGTRTAVVRLGSVHYREGASWLPIDTAILPAVGRQGYAWQNGPNGFRVFFRQLLTEGFMRLETQGHTVALTLEDANPLASAIPAGPRITYANAFPGADLRYTVFPDGVKKELVLASASAPSHYRFRLSVLEGGALQAQQQGDGSWTFLTPPNTPLFSIPPVFAREAARRYDRMRHASMTVQPEGNDFLIDLDVDSAWLNEPQRSFPVVLDPTIPVQPPTLDEDFKNPCPGGQPCPFPDTNVLGIGAEGTVGSWAAMKFTSLGIPSSAYVTDASAELRFQYRSCFENINVSDPCRAQTLDTFKMTADWTTSTRTENLFYATPRLDWYDLPADPGDHWMFWDITTTARGWVNGQIANYGLLFKRNPDAANPENGPIVPASGYTGDPQYRPKLVITYHLPPNQPTLDSPSDAAAVDMTTPVLRASATDPDNDQLDLHFQVATDSGFTNVIRDEWVLLPVNVNTGTYTVPPASPPNQIKDGQTYYWRVQARDEPAEGVYQTSLWSASRSFLVRLKKLGVRDYWPMWSRGPIAVNQANGNLVLTLPGPSYPYGTNSMGASVSFNSQAATTDLGLGPRWTLDVGSEASPPTKLVDHNLLTGDQQFDAVERISGDGSSDYYTHVAGSNTYLSTPGDGAQLTKNADGTWTLLDPDGAIYTFGAADGNGVALITSSEWVDEAAFQTPLHYCFNGTKVTSIRNATCGGSPSRELSFVWNSINPAGCLAAILCITGPDTVTWKYIGDAGGGTSGKLIKINNGTRDIVEITYTASNLPWLIRNANDLDPTNASPGYDPNHKLEIRYDTQNPQRVEEVIDGPVTNQSATSKWTFQYFTAANCPHALTTPRTSHDFTRPFSLEGCTSLKPPRQQPPGPGATITTFYDNLGHPMEVRDLLGNTTGTAYDERDQLRWSEDELGNPTDVGYADVEGNATTNPWVATAQAMVTGPDPDGAGPLARPVTRTRYDETRMGEDLLTASGGLITDAVRLAAIEGDGRASPDSSFGIWEGTTNLVTNGSFEIGTFDWTPTEATLFQYQLRGKFGGDSLRVTSTGKPFYSAATTTGLSGATAGRTFSGSFWAYAEGSAVGKTLSAILREEGGASDPQESAASQTLVSGWQRLTVTRSLAQNDRTTLRLLASRPSGATTGEYVDLDGAQLEEKPAATPYVETDGSPSRASGRVQAPSSLVGATTGWVAIRMRAGVGSSGSNLRLFTWGANSTDELYLRYGAGSFRMARVFSGETSEVAQSASFAAGDTVTVIGAWHSAGLSHWLKVSVNGGAFATQLIGGSSQPAGAMFDLGQRGYAAQDFANSDILWAAVGYGTLTDADAAAIHGSGSETPGTWSYPTSATATAVWTADTAAYQLPLPSAGPRVQGLQAAYYANRNVAGRPTKLKNDSQVTFSWGTGGPPELPGTTDNFSVRWSGYVKVTTAGNYVFGTLADDGVRLTVDGVLAINNWAESPGTLCSQPVNLTVGLHKLSLEYFEAGGSAQAHLRWTSGACGTEQAIPASALVPAWFNQTSSVSPAGRTSFSHFPDPANARSDYSLVRLLDGTNLITSLAYDAYGRVTEKVMPKGNANRTIDANGTLQGSPDSTFATSYAYYAPSEFAILPPACGTGSPIDQAQLLKSTTPRGIATTTFVYDRAGRQVAKTNGVGTTCSSYDNESRLTSTIAPGDAQPTTYTHDPAGAQRTATDASGTVTSEYDEQGRVKRSLDSFGAEAKFKYDEEGNLLCRIASNGTLPPGNANCGAGTNYTTSYGYDAENRLTSLTDPAGRPYAFFYDTRGNLKATQYPNFTFSWNDYNAGGWLTALYNRHGELSAPLPPNVPADADPIVDFAYVYEQDGKKTQQTRTGGNGLPTEVEKYRFDGLGRMDAVSLPDGTFRRYLFDLDSNRTQITENGQETARYVYDPSNPNSPGVDQLTSEVVAGTSFAHRADGEMTSRGADTLTWDGWGRLTGGTFGGTNVIYSFDPLGFRRVRTNVTAGTTTRYLHDGIFETDVAGAITLTDVDGPEGDLAHFAGPPTTGSIVTHLYYNGHGDLAAQADSAGNRTAALTYDPFGAPKQLPPANKAIERFTGRWDKKLDTSSGLIEMGARPYDPKLGRFLAVDPIDGGSLNNYEYAAQDPVNEFDLSGLALGCGETRGGCGDPVAISGNLRSKGPPPRPTAGKKGKTPQQAPKQRPKRKKGPAKTGPRRPAKEPGKAKPGRGKRFPPRRRPPGHTRPWPPRE